MKSDENNWVPTPKQARFLSLPYEILEGFYAGAVAAGKTDVLLWYPIIHRFHENPRFKGLFLRRTFPELKNEVIPRSRGFYRRLGATYNKNDKVWEFPSGALIFFGHCENEDDVHNYDSMQPNYVAFDELTSFTEWQYLYITLQRIRSTIDSGLPAICRSASNPGNIGHTWVRKRFVDPYPEGGMILQTPSGTKRIFIHATVRDNPYIDPVYLRQLESIPDRAEREAKLYGKWDAFEGQVFEEFRDRQFPEEPQNALHVIPENGLDIPLWWPRIVSIDWGFAPPAMNYVCYGAVSPEKRLVIYREQAWQKTKISEWAPYVKEFIDVENPRVIKLCRSAGQDKGQEHTLQGEVSNNLGRAVDLVELNKGSRVTSKALVHEYLRWKEKYQPVVVKEPFSQEKSDYLLRNRTLKEYKAYLESFLPPEPETNLPKLLITDNCKLLIEAIKSCVYDDKNVEDVAEFPGDDPYDALRYIVDAAERYFDESALEFEKIKKTEMLIKHMQATQDMTAYYRNARLLDKQSRGPVGVRRYHKRKKLSFFDKA